MPRLQLHFALPIALGWLATGTTPCAEPLPAAGPPALPQALLQLTTDAAQDVLLLKLPVPNLAAGEAASVSLTPARSAGPENVRFSFVEHLDPGTPQSVLIFRADVDSVPPRWFVHRKATLAIGSESRKLPFVLSNLRTADQKFTVEVPITPWVIDRTSACTPFDVITGDAPATDVRLSAFAIAEKAGADRLSSDHLSVSCPSCGPQPIAIPPKTRATLSLCIDEKWEGYGEYTGEVKLTAREFPPGAGAQLKIYSTSSRRQSEGVLLLVAGVVLAWFVRNYVSSRITRDQALLGATIQRDRAQGLMPSVQALQADFSPESLDLVNYLSDLLNTRLTSQFLDAQQFVSPRIPLPFQFSPRSTQLAAFLNEVDTALNLIAVLVPNGIVPILSRWRSQNPNNKAAFQAAVKEVNRIFIIRQDLNTARANIQTEIVRLDTATGQPPMVAVAAAAAASAPAPLPATGTLLLELRRLSQAICIVICLLTVAAGWVVLIGKNPGFGRPVDLLFCFFWGVGLPVTVNSLMPSSVLNLFSGSAMRVSATV